MVERYAIVADGVVWTVTEWDAAAAPGWQPPAGTAVACGPEVGVGWTYDGESFAAPAAEGADPQG
jgi:hypothetical protein